MRVNANEAYEVGRYDKLLHHAEGLAVRDVATSFTLYSGQAIVYWGCLAATMALCATRVSSGTLTVMHIYICIYIYMYIHMYICIHTHIYIYKERERKT